MSKDSMRRRRRRRSSSPALAASLPDNDDLLREIFLRLPPLPSSLPRASLVSKRWRRILSDPQFIRSFRAFHHRRAQLLGLFICDDFEGNLHFTPTLDPPNRVPSAPLYLTLSRPEGWRFLDCRHGLVLILNLTHPEITVWDCITGDQRCVALPPGYADFHAFSCGALLCDDHAGRVPLESFKAVLFWTVYKLRNADQHDQHVFAFLYESKADVWSNVISTCIRDPLRLFKVKASVLVGNSLYWLLLGQGKSGILKFDLDTKNLTVTDTPRNVPVNIRQSQILRMEDSRLGLATPGTGFSIQVWEKKPNSEGGAKWMLHKTINDVPMLLSLRPSRILIHGCDEDGDAIFVSSSDDPQVFIVQLKSLQFKSLFKESNIITGTYHPFSSFFTTGKGIGSGDIGAEILNNT